MAVNDNRLLLMGFQFGQPCGNGVHGYEPGRWYVNRGMLFRFAAIEQQTRGAALQQGLHGVYVNLQGQFGGIHFGRWLPFQCRGHADQIRGFSVVRPGRKPRFGERGYGEEANVDTDKGRS